MPKKQQEHDWSIPAVESEFQGNSAPAIKAATSAFTYFQSDCFSNVRGGGVSQSGVATTTDKQWPFLSAGGEAAGERRICAGAAGLQPSETRAAHTLTRGAP